MPESPFHHIALNVDAETQDAIEARVRAAGYELPNFYVLEHGYCRSIYVVDPNGMTVEFTRDAKQADRSTRLRKQDAHSELKRWLAGDHSINNNFRHEEDEAEAA